MTGMFFRFLTVVLLSAFLAGSAFPQSTNVTVQPDLRLFTMMAALNAAGFDVEVASRQYHPVREIVRTYAKDVDPELIARLKSFYSLERVLRPMRPSSPNTSRLAVNLNGAPCIYSHYSRRVVASGREVSDRFSGHDARVLREGACVAALD